jgi:hypothetical protein
MIKNFLEAVEENGMAALMVCVFLFAMVALAGAAISSLSEDKTAVEMGKLGCKQNVQETHYGITKYWVCPNGVQESK